VKAPSRTGFGTILLKRVLAYEADGQAELPFHTSGVEFNFRLPLSDNVRLLWLVGDAALFDDAWALIGDPQLGATQGNE